ncbi:hypothetical protein F0L17_03590 [Streptomyces sp. TRM43335]|uniref:Uncharacterized protein n=1 Tax=Streptomyces taklimakanensis TaxID=2569853 RepID=A0A6G2B7I6_9ACTN|nr:hypothetical protein [Streptomyces taklimakanensis]MTE18227.1 hypothetical protein [Streptomyces taklimakanensis]
MRHTTEDRHRPAGTEPLGDDRSAGSPEPGSPGCLYALSQPPLMLFLGVVAGLVFLAAAHDLFLL